MDGKINVHKNGRVISHNVLCIKLQYTIKLVSPTIGTSFTVPTIGGGHEISQIPSSQFSSEPKSTGCANFTVKAESLLSL